VLQELEPDEYGKIRPLLQGQFAHSLSIYAVIEGNNPGRVFVDRVDQPRVAFVVTGEAAVLVGDHGDPASLEALRRFFKESVFTGQMQFMDESMDLVVHPATWEARLPELIPTHEIEKLTCYHYLCNKVEFAWRARIPKGYTVHPIDQALLENPDIVIPNEILAWPGIEENWGTIGNFVAKGVGFCVLHQSQVVSRCAADCVVGDQIEIGIITAPDHRRQGLATIAAAATVEHCLSRGFNTVGWYCDADNVGSQRTAERVGFERAGEYTYYYYMIDEIDHLAELGWYHYKREEYDRTTHYYERVFALRGDNPHYYHHLAAAAWAAQGNHELAFKHLHAAVDRGWAWPERTKRVDELQGLQADPEWEVVLARMEENAS
jgi:RimJ/RimL family protein N-acetyltransferase